MLRPATAYACAVFVGVFVIMTYCASLEFVLICANSLECVPSKWLCKCVYMYMCVRERKNIGLKPYCATGFMWSERARVLEHRESAQKASTRMCKHNQYSTCASVRSHLCCSTGTVVDVCACASFRASHPPKDVQSRCTKSDARQKVTYTSLSFSLFRLLVRARW